MVSMMVKTHIIQSEVILMKNVFHSTTVQFFFVSSQISENFSNINYQRLKIQTSTLLLSNCTILDKLLNTHHQYIVCSHRLHQVEEG